MIFDLGWKGWGWVGHQRQGRQVGCMDGGGQGDILRLWM